MSDRPKHYYFVPEEGYVGVKAYRDHQPAPFAVLKTKLARRFSAFGLIKKDLDLIKQNLRLLQDGVTDQTIKQSLSFFAVVTYGKCFAQAEGRGVKLEIETIKDLPEELKKEHQQLINQRNKYVAHAGGEGWEQNAIVAAINPESRSLLQVYPTIVYLIDIDSQLENFWLLVAFLDDYVTDQLKKTFAKLLEETRATEFDDLAKKAIYPKWEDLESFNYFAK